MARLAMAVAGVVLREDFLQRRRFSVMQIGRCTVNTQQRRRVVTRAKLLGRIIAAGAHVVHYDLAAGPRAAVSGSAMAFGAAGFFGKEQVLTAACAFVESLL